MIHESPHPEHHQGVTIDLKEIHPQLGDDLMFEATIIDWWDRLAKKSWVNSQDIPAVKIYALRNAFGVGIPVDDEVLLVMVGKIPLLIHETEILR